MSARFHDERAEALRAAGDALAKYFPMQSRALLRQCRRERQKAKMLRAENEQEPSND